MDQTIVKQWYTDIIEDEINHPIVLEAIEAQMNLSNELYIKLTSVMKKVFTSYANDVKDLTTVLDFYNVFHNLKSPMMDKLPFINDLKNFNSVNTIFNDIVAGSEFSTEMIRIYSNILANKLDNDDIDINNNKLNRNNLTRRTRESRERKCNNQESNISNSRYTSIIKSSSKKLKKNNQIKTMYQYIQQE